MTIDDAAGGADGLTELEVLRAVATGLVQTARTRQRRGTATGDRQAERYFAIQSRVKAAATAAKRGPVMRDDLGVDATATARDLRNAAKVHRERGERQAIVDVDAQFVNRNLAKAEMLEGIAKRLSKR